MLNGARTLPKCSNTSGKRSSSKTSGLSRWTRIPLSPWSRRWHGITCDVGYLDVWLSDQVTSSLRGPLKMLAKFPQRDPPGVTVAVLIGLEFHLAHLASFNLDPPPQQGAIRIP